VFANQAVPGLTERTTSVLIAFGLLGGGLMPRVAGWCLDQSGPAATRWLFTLDAVLMLAIIGAAIELSRRVKRPAVLFKDA